MALSVGQRVETLIDNGGMKGLIKAGEFGVVTNFDRWIGEEYPYVVQAESGKSAAYARHELREV